MEEHKRIEEIERRVQRKEKKEKKHRSSHRSYHHRSNREAYGCNGYSDEGEALDFLFYVKSYFKIHSHIWELKIVKMEIKCRSLESLISCNEPSYHCLLKH